MAAITNTELKKVDILMRLNNLEYEELQTLEEYANVIQSMTKEPEKIKVKQDPEPFQFD